ncbi:CbtB domain-containing protein [Amphibiibacter pelophylacis]|uniref:CbtB domain-containing protein n=1 Tax=Amphibiibacter pelophylacis TaxID=1799477 RepID=A0ACC6NYC4_9BURK
MMTSTPAQNPSRSTAADAVTATRKALALQLGGALMLALVLFYGVGFAHSPLAHNAAHDVRHVTVKPCH